MVKCNYWVTSWHETLQYAFKANNHFVISYVNLKMSSESVYREYLFVESSRLLMKCM